MDVNDDAGNLKERGVLAFIASKLAPTNLQKGRGLAGDEKKTRPNGRVLL